MLPQSVSPFLLFAKAVAQSQLFFNFFFFCPSVMSTDLFSDEDDSNYIKQKKRRKYAEYEQNLAAHNLQFVAPAVVDATPIVFDDIDLPQQQEQNPITDFINLGESIIAETEIDMVDTETGDKASLRETTLWEAADVIASNLCRHTAQADVVSSCKYFVKEGDAGKFAICGKDTAVRCRQCESI
jgi:hypothetical protein